jgi:hypothetical protein
MTMPAPPFPLAAGETVLATSSAGWIESKLQMMPGQVWLTDRRLEFHGSKGLFTALFGLIGRAYAKRKVLSVPLEGIARAERTSFGRNKNVLLVVDRGGAEHKLVVDKFDDVVAPLKERTRLV